MKRPSLSHDTAFVEGATFPVPADASAWWAFLSSSGGGLLLVQLSAAHKMPDALLLVAACACLLLCSDWVSSLSGKGLSGEVPRGRLRSLPGWGLLSIGLACFAAFYHRQSEFESRFWMGALGCAGALTALMFLFRLEWLPDDLRLLALTSLLCTTPALFLAFLAKGEHTGVAWLFWFAPALYFPVSSVFAWTWLKGLYDQRRHVAILAAPLLALIVAALSFSADLAALTVTAYLFYIIQRLLRRYRHDPDSLPAFSEIRKLGREQAVWNAIIVIGWLLNGVAVCC